jgi:transposase
MKPSYSKTELANLYKVSYNTMMSWIKKVPDLKIPKNRRILTPKEVNQVFKYLGSPI